MLKKFFSITLVLFWLLLIFTLSHAPSDASTEQSKTIVNQIIGNTNQTNNTEVVEIENNAPIELKEDSPDIEYLNYIVRKIAHMSEYFILALLVLNVIYQFKEKIDYKYYIMAISFCVVYATTDEFHQTFVTGRTGQFSDVLIDTLGASIACLFVMLIEKYKKSFFSWKL